MTRELAVLNLVFLSVNIVRFKYIDDFEYKYSARLSVDSLSFDLVSCVVS